jgi:PspAB-like protein
VVKFLDALFGRTQPKKPDLDQLFGVPSAALTLEVAGGFKPTGAGSVCYRAAEGGAFAATQADVQELLDADDGPKVERVQDEYGYTWLVVRHDPSDMSGLVTDLHAVNSSLEAAGFGPSLLCSLAVFIDGDGRRLALVYLYKRGSFYPFAPTGSGQQRDNTLELQVRGMVANDLRVEQDLSRWFPVWGAPGL